MVGYMYIQLKFKNKIEMSKEKASREFISLKMNQIMESNTNLTPKIENLMSLLSYYPLEILFSHLSSNKSVIKVIKWLTLLHNLILRLPNQRDKLHELIDSVKVHQKQMTALQAVLLDKLIAPYKLYLFRRNMLTTGQVDQNSEVYHLINILRNALSFTDVLFVMGRYMYHQYSFLADFNIVIAKDLSAVYGQLRLKLTEEIAVENAEVLEKINEGLYIVFYNCYFSHFVGKFSPVWINTEKLFSQNGQISKDPKSKHHPKEKQVDQTIFRTFLEQEEETNISLIWNDDEPIKSSSTIDSHKDIVDAHISRKEFIAMAEELIHEIEGKEVATERMKGNLAC